MHLNTFPTFDDLFFERAVHLPTQTQSFPHYNIMTSKDGNKVKLTLALAGFGQSDLDIELKEGTLNISGQCPETNVSDEWKVVHKGIAARKFSQSFKVSPHFDISEAYTTNGLLVVNLERVAGFAKKIQIGEKPTVVLTEPEKTLLNE